MAMRSYEVQSNGIALHRGAETSHGRGQRSREEQRNGEAPCSFEAQRNGIDKLGSAAA